MMFLQNAKIQNALAPVADYQNSDPATDIFNMENYNRIVFIVHLGVGTTGTADLTIESCDDTTPTTATAVVFDYSAATTLDTWSAVTRATASGLRTTAGSNAMYAIEIRRDMLSGTDKYVRLQITEVVNAEVLAGVIAIQLEPRYASDADGMQGALT